jgi:hypothetical protein
VGAWKFIYSLLDDKQVMPNGLPRPTEVFTYSSFFTQIAWNHETSAPIIDIPLALGQFGARCSLGGVWW